MFSYIKYYFIELVIRLVTLNYFVIRRIVSSSIDRHFEDVKTIKVLDLGCGNGTLSSFFHKKGYVGFDIDMMAIKIAKISKRGYRFITADATDFSLDTKFDLILVSGVLHHLNDRDFALTLKRMKTHLKKNGKALLIEATWPIHKWNFLGKLLRRLDQGKYVRSLARYTNLIKPHFKILEKYNKIGGLVDYAVIVVAHKENI